MADCNTSSTSTVDLDATMPLNESVSDKSDIDRRMKRYKKCKSKRLIFNYKKLNIFKHGAKSSNIDFQFRLGTDIQDLDVRYIKKSENMISSDIANTTCICATSWDFIYPPNAKSREHCSRIIYDSVGQPDTISMRQTNRGYEICELTWYMKDKHSIPECFQNWDIIGRIEVCLPVYLDTEDGSVKYEGTYMANFRIIDRNCEVFHTKDWARTTSNMLYSLNEYESCSSLSPSQTKITRFF